MEQVDIARTAHPFTAAIRATPLEMMQVAVRLSNFWDRGIAAHAPERKSLRPDYDVVIVGAGYSGLATAAGLAREGLAVLVLEEKSVGHGASSRNGGMVGPSFHDLGILGLTRKYGADKARDIMRTGIDALDYAQDVFTSKDMFCHFAMTGRFRGARTEAHLEAMIAECRRLNKDVGLPFEVVGRAGLSHHTGATCYVGGVVYPRDGGLQPRCLVNALARRAEALGAQIHDNTAVAGVRRHGKRFEVVLSSGTVKAKRIVLATNGYSDGRVGPVSKRVVPISVSVCTTRELGEERVRAMSPRFHMHGESGRVFIWSRPTPDRKRFLFGGRIANRSAPAERQRRQFAATVGRLYPELEPEDFEHIWHGKIAYTMDHAPHLNEVDGIWLIGGYCGSGVTRSLYFADKLVRKMTGQSGADTPFDDLPFPEVPFRPFAPFGARLLTAYYGWRDRCELPR